jgi:opacity protein-like surface antigen
LYRSHTALLAVAGSLILSSLAVSSLAQQKDPDQSPITIVRKPGQEDGEAQMTVNGKVRRIAPHAVEAFKVRGGEGALILIMEPAKGTNAKQYLLRYYDLETGRRRVLGALPMSAVTLTESEAKGEVWAFALSGTDLQTHQPLIAVGDDQAIPGRLPGAESPALHNDVLSYTLGGETREARLGVLLGTAKGDIYAPPVGPQTAPKLLQVFPNGAAMALTTNGTMLKGTWQTDGNVLQLQSEKKTIIYSVPWADLETVKGVPAAKRFGVRLLGELSSRKTHQGDIVKAVSITPVVVNEEILIPAGSNFEGKVVQANSTGWGFKHETASLTIDWTKATLAGGRELAIDMRVFQVENAQETVTDKGKIQGIRSTGTVGRSAENGVLTFAGIDPIAYIFAAAAGSAVLGFAEPEILYPAGTELILENITPLLTSQAYPPSVQPAATTGETQTELQTFVKKLPYRTRTKGSNKVSDLTNLVFVGSASGLERAFKAAGWLPTEDLTAGSTFRTLKTLSGNQTYTQAPMSILLLDEREPVFGLSKTTNTFSARHHIRVFPTAETRDGHTVLTASSTQDIGIAFSRKQKTFIHVIDEHIDNERAKVVNDLMFTGCVESLDMVERPWVPRDAYNSTGDRLLTDSEVAVLRISDCQTPNKTPDQLALKPPRGQRVTRDTALTVRNDLYRGNLIYQGISGAIMARKYFRSQSELPSDVGAWRMTDASGSQYKGFGKGSVVANGSYNSTTGLHRRNPGDFSTQPSPEDLAAIQRAKENHKWDPPRYEFALQGGYVHMRSSFLSAVGVLEESSLTDADHPTYFIFLGDSLGDGWAAGGSVTVNSWKYISNEFSYFRQQVKYELGSVSAAIPPGESLILDDSDLDTQRIGLVTRQFAYNLLLHARPPTSRWRPYVAIGPAFQLVALNGNPLKKPAGVFTLGLKNIGLLKAAFDFGGTPPLDGGGIFQFGLQYGAGIKYRVSPRVMLRADFRETWSKNPDIIANSYEDYDSNVLDDTYTTTVIREHPDQKFIKDRYTLGVAFTF